MSDKPETEVSDIPGDLAEIGVPIWTPAAVRRYADKLAARLDDPKIEGKYRLARHRKIERARKLGDRDPYRAAELLRQVEALCDAPDTERGKKAIEDGRRGGEESARRKAELAANETREITDAVATMRAKNPSISMSCAMGLVARKRGCSTSTIRRRLALARKLAQVRAT